MNSEVEPCTMDSSNKRRTLPLEAEQIQSRNGMPPWVVDQLYQQFLDDYWSTGAGELSSKPLDPESLPKEVYIRAFAQRGGRRTTEDLAYRQRNARPPSNYITTKLSSADETCRALAG